MGPIGAADGRGPVPQISPSAVPALPPVHRARTRADPSPRRLSLLPQVGDEIDGHCDDDRSEQVGQQSVPQADLAD